MWIEVYPEIPGAEPTTRNKREAPSRARFPAAWNEWNRAARPQHAQVALIYEAHIGHSAIGHANAASPPSYALSFFVVVVIPGSFLFLNRRCKGSEVLCFVLIASQIHLQPPS